MSSVGLELLCSHGLLETDVCTIPQPLTTLNPVVHTCDRRGFARPREQGRLKPPDALEGGEACGRMGERVLGIFCAGEKL